LITRALPSNSKTLAIYTRCAECGAAGTGSCPA